MNWKKHKLKTETFKYKTRFNIKTDCRLLPMEVALTKMSQNGQVVIPSEIRKDACIKPSTKFLVFNEGGNILLKQIKKEHLAKDIELLEKIQRSEEEIKKGKYTKTDTKMSEEEIDDLLMD